VDYVFRNIKPWPGDVKEKSEYIPKCCKGHNLEYTDLRLQGKGCPETEKMICIHYRNKSLKDKLKQVTSLYPGNPLAMSNLLSI
jgi:hypothetical protein